MSTAQLDLPGYRAGTWTIDVAHSYVGFVIKHMMVSKVRGRFAAFSGRITLAEEALESSVTVTIDPASIDTSDTSRDAHVRSADFFDTPNHPSMTFTSTKVRYDSGKFFIDGNLTIRGTTRPITLAVDTPEFGPTQDGGTKAGFSATTEINRADFGVSYNGPIPGGGMALGEKVQIVLEIEADLEQA